MFPYVIAMVVANLVTGGLVRKLGRYWPFMFTGPIFAIVGSGLFYTINANDTKKVMGWQIILGFGIGQSFQLGSMSCFFGQIYKLTSLQLWQYKQSMRTVWT